MALNPDDPATPKQRAKLGALQDHEAANRRDLTAGEASRLIDALSKPPTAPEKRITVVSPAPPPSPAQEDKEAWCEIGVWVPVSRVGVILEAIREARAGT